MNDDFALSFQVKAGDTNADGVTNDVDLVGMWRALRKPVGQRDLNYDLNGDGQVNEKDLDLLKSKYLTKGSTPPLPQIAFQSPIPAASFAPVFAPIFSVALPVSGLRDRAMTLFFWEEFDSLTRRTIPATLSEGLE